MIFSENVINKYRDSFKRDLDCLTERICPDEKIRLKFIVGTHFVERLFERIPSWHSVKIEVLNWIDKEYCMLLYEANLNPELIIHERVDFDLFNGTIILSIFNKEVSLRTCYKKEIVS